MSADRREFVRQGGLFLAATLLGGCAAAIAVRLAPDRRGLLRLPLLAYPQLAGAGGALKLQVEGTASQVYVLALPEGGYAAVSPICAHLGCTVGIEGEHLVCPCHGSTYDRRGGLLKGPAQRGLRRYRTMLDEGGVLVIDLETPA
jgi:Rieske Fe-S protein